MLNIKDILFGTRNIAGKCEILWVSYAKSGMSPSDEIFYEAEWRWCPGIASDMHSSDKKQAHWIWVGIMYNI